MRRIAAISILIVVVQSFAFGSEMDNAIKKDIANRWAVAEGVHSGKPLLIRARYEFKDREAIPEYSELIKVTWPYDGGPSGMPDPESSKSMEVFENRLVSAVEKDLSAVLTAAVTNNNERLWIYYTKSVPEFIQHLHDIPQETTPYPIKITAESDPSWAFLHKEILRGMKDGKP